MRKIDLHTHSFFSDGSMSPTELLFHAKEVGLSALALTDHDTVAGIPRRKTALNLCREWSFPQKAFRRFTSWATILTAPTRA